MLALSPRVKAKLDLSSSRKLCRPFCPRRKLPASLYGVLEYEWEMGCRNCRKSGDRIRAHGVAEEQKNSERNYLA